MPVISLKNRDSYARYAAPESIAAYLKKAKAAAAAATREVVWLTELLERRTAERDSGAWPANAHEETSR